MWGKLLSYFADRNEVGNEQYEGLIGRIYHKLKCTLSLTYLYELFYRYSHTCAQSHTYSDIYYQIVFNSKWLEVT